MHGTKILLVFLIKHFGTRCLYNKVKKYYPYILKEIEVYAEANYPYLIRKDFTFMEKTYQYIYDLDVRPSCLTCNMGVPRFYSFHKGYGLFCSNDCVANNSTVIKERKKTIMSKYNIDSFFNKIKNNF